jgi:hypothetical protein
LQSTGSALALEGGPRIDETYMDHPPRKLQNEGYSGPITLTRYQRFPWARDKLKDGGFSLPTRTGN